MRPCYKGGGRRKEKDGRAAAQQQALSHSVRSGLTDSVLVACGRPQHQYNPNAPSPDPSKIAPTVGQGGTPALPPSSSAFTLRPYPSTAADWLYGLVP
jgi:hypothetical protein